jgi:hypothetical protein
MTRRGWWCVFAMICSIAAADVGEHGHVGYMMALAFWALMGLINSM